MNSKILKLSKHLLVKRNTSRFFPLKKRTFWFFLFSKNLSRNLGVKFAVLLIYTFFFKLQGLAYLHTKGKMHRDIKVSLFNLI